MIIEIDKTQYKVLLSVKQFNKIIENDTFADKKLFEHINEIPGVFNTTYSCYDEPVIWFMVSYKYDSECLHEQVKTTIINYIK